MKKFIKQQPKTLSPENYIKTKARMLPISKCLVMRSWKEIGLSQVVLCRQYTTRNIIFAAFLIDLYALGIKNSIYNFNQPQSVIANLASRGNFVEIPYSLAHNIVCGALKFADKHGYKLHKYFEKLGKFILDPDDDKIPFRDVEFGRDGKPFVIIGSSGT